MLPLPNPSLVMEVKKESLFLFLFLLITGLSEEKDKRQVFPELIYGKI